MKKRLLSIILVISLICGLLVIIPVVSGSALSTSEIHSKLAEILYQGNGGYVSCGFDGYTTTPGRHEGIDFCCYKGAPVYSLINGTVIRVNNTSSSLSTLAIYDEANNKSVIYLHTANICVSRGSSVRQGQLVAYESNRGASAAHTHVEVRNGWQQYASYSVNDPSLDNPNPYPYWESILSGVIPPDPFVVDGNYPTPITAKPAATSGKITVYNSSLSAYSQNTRYIDWNDQCTINAIYTNGYCNVTYPSGNSTHTEYAKTSDFIPNGVTPYAWHSDNDMTTYVRSDMGTVFGSISAVDTCIVVGKSGNKLQLIYPLNSGGYKLGWVDATVIPPSDFPTPMIGYTTSSSNIYAHASLNSMGDTYGQVFPDDRCTLTSVSVSGGWVYVTYPLTGGGSKSGYVYLNDFVPDSSRLAHFYTTRVTQQTDTFRKSDMAVNFGWVTAADELTVVGKSGNKLQILYKVDEEYGGGYKIAWIYDTNIIKNLTGISVTTQPSKTAYLEGENLSTSGLVITASYDDGSTANVPTNSCSFSGYDSTPGVKTVTVTYNGKQTAFTVSVKSKSPTELSITSLPNKTIYNIGEPIDLTGLQLKATFDNGDIADVTSYDPISDSSITNSAGKKEVIISYAYNAITVNAVLEITVQPGEVVNPTSPKFVVSQVKAQADSTITVDISIENNPGITSFNYQVSYPSSLTLVGIEYKDLFSSRATGSNKLQSPFTMSWFSTNSEDESKNGTIATMTFKVSADAADGKYPITLTYDEDNVFDSSYENKHFDVINGYVEVISSIPGDVNGDTKINMKDIVLLQQYLNGWNVTIDNTAANVNGDSSINMKDIVLLQQYLNGWNVVLK